MTCRSPTGIVTSLPALPAPARGAGRVRSRSTSPARSGSAAAGRARFAVPGSPASGCAPWPTCRVRIGPRRPLDRRHGSAGQRPATKPDAGFVSAEEDEPRSHRHHRREGRTLWAGVPPRPHARPDAVRTEASLTCPQYPRQGQSMPVPAGQESRSSRPRRRSRRRTRPGSDRTIRVQTPRTVIGADLRRAANAEHKQWRPLQRYLGRREYFDQIYAAIAAWSPTAPPSGNPASQPARSAGPNANRAPSRNPAGPRAVTVAAADPVPAAKSRPTTDRVGAQPSAC